MEGTPYINMHAIWGTYEDLVETGRGILRVNFREAPHTQKGQIPDLDWPADDVVETYTRTMRNIAESNLQCDVEINPVKSEEWDAMYFDVKKTKENTKT